jgi:hypothetical protein
MRLTTAENHISRIQNRLDSVYRSALFQRPDFINLNEQFGYVMFKDSAWDKLPEWVKERLTQHRWNLRNIIVREHTIQLYTLRDGRRVVSRHSWDAMDEESRQFIRDGGELPIKTYWLESKETCAPDGTITIVKSPTDSVYYESGLIK